MRSTLVRVALNQSFLMLAKVERRHKDVVLFRHYLLATFSCSLSNRSDFCVLRE